MASQSRRRDRNLVEEVKREGPRFAFCQAVRVLALSGERCSLPAGVRFRTPASLAFPASEVAQVRVPRSEPDTADHHPDSLEMEVGFLGLTGPSGALPTHYTELLIERAYLHRDRSAHAFLDLFSHRAISQFYEAWRKYRFAIEYEQGAREGFTQNLLDWVGVGLGQLRKQLAETDQLPDRFIAYFSGLLSQKPISASAIAALARGLFQVNVTLEQFVGHWIALPNNEQSRIGLQANQLGVSSVAGSRVWDRQTKIRLVIGPLTREQYQRFLPGQPAASALSKLLQFCVGHAIACDARLVLQRLAVPMPRLGGATVQASGMQLGFNTWLVNATPAEDRADAVYALLK